MSKSLSIYTDGGCSGNPGPGGWAYVIVKDTSRRGGIIAMGQGSEDNTTNNRMELIAVIESLRVLKKLDNSPKQATVYTDSQYVQKGITEWIFNWKNNLWITSDRKPVKNQDLWKALDSLAGEYSLVWKWVRGHSGNKYNEMCDRMTRDAVASIRL